MWFVGCKSIMKEMKRNGCEQNALHKHTYMHINVSLCVYVFIYVWLEFVGDLLVLLFQDGQWSKTLIQRVESTFTCLEKTIELSSKLKWRDTKRNKDSREFRRTCRAF